MLSIRNILVGTDFSESSDDALNYGRALAAAFGARLHVLHSLESPSATLMGMDGYLAAVPTLQAEVEQRAREDMNRVVTEDDERRFNAKSVIETSRSPSDAIIDYAKRQGIDLIVVGTNGRRGLSHLVMGSVAETVVRLAGCPVLTVHHGERSFVKPDQITVCEIVRA